MPLLMRGTMLNIIPEWAKGIGEGRGDGEGQFYGCEYGDNGTRIGSGFSPGFMDLCGIGSGSGCGNYGLGHPGGGCGAGDGVFENE